MREEEFWRLTLAQLDALGKRYDAQEERLDYRSAQICWLLAEINRNPKKRARPFKLEDFMPRKKKKALTPEQLVKQIEAAMFACGGEKKNG